MVVLVLSGAILSLGFPLGRKAAGHTPDFLRDLGFRSGPRGTPWAWTMALLLAIAYIAFSASQIPQISQQWAAVSLLKALSILAAIVAGIVEEGLFRRLLMDAAMNRGAPAWVQVAVTGLVFGLAHGTWGLLGGVHVAVGAALATSILGTGLGIVYLAGRRSLAPCIVAHILIDAIIEPGLLLSAVGQHIRA